MLADATVGPILSLNGTLVFLPSCFAAATCLTYVFLAALLADVTVYSLLFGWVYFSFVFSRVHATLQSAPSVRPSVGPSVGPSVTLCFFALFFVILGCLELF